MYHKEEEKEEEEETQLCFKARGKLRMNMVIFVSCEYVFLLYLLINFGCFYLIFDIPKTQRIHIATNETFV